MCDLFGIDRKFDPQGVMEASGGASIFLQELSVDCFPMLSEENINLVFSGAETEGLELNVQGADCN